MSKLKIPRGPVDKKAKSDSAEASDSSVQETVVAAPEQDQPFAASQPAVPFKVEAPGQISNSGVPNIVQRRQEKIAAATEGHSFTYDRQELGQQFSCICGATGKNAIVLIREDGQEVRVGDNCLKKCLGPDGKPVVKPKQSVRAANDGRGPGLSKQQKFAEALKSHPAPYTFVGRQEAPFTCLCGGPGVNQNVVRDANGAEFSVGDKCATYIPGLELPKAQRKAAEAAVPQIAGLKGQAAPPPTFENVG